MRTTDPDETTLTADNLGRASTFAEGMEQLRAELEAMMKAALQAERRKIPAGVSSTTPSTQQIYVAAGRRLGRFREKPEKHRDPSVQEWVSDVRGQLAARQVRGEGGAHAAFIVDHLAGRASQAGNPWKR